MKKIFYHIILLITAISLSFSNLSSQDLFSLSGLITDQDGEKLVGASIFLEELNRGAVSNIDGFYKIDNLKKDKYKIKISFLGYQTIIDSIIINSNTVYNAILQSHSLNLQEVIISDKYAEELKKHESLSIEIVSQKYLQQYLNSSLMKTLERLPGISTIDIGSGQSKPVIRGLGFNRVLLIENGIRHESQQWGEDHGLEIDQFFADNIEVIKGPSSLKYGSEAIGGLIKINQNNIAAKNSIKSKINFFTKSNSNSIGTSASVSLRKKQLYFGFRFTLVNNGDYKVPTDSIDVYSFKVFLKDNYLRNTASNEKNFHLNFGYISKKFSSKFFLSNISSKNGFFANAHGLEPRNIDYNLHDKSNFDINYPYQKVNHFKIINRNSFKYSKKIEFNLDIAYQKNYRQEWSKYVEHGFMPSIFPDNLNFNPDLERQFDKKTFSANFDINYDLSEKTNFSYGLNLNNQSNSIDGRGFIIPAFKDINLGNYIYAKHKFNSKNIIQIGLRYDIAKLKIQEYYDWFKSVHFSENDTIYEYLQRAENLSLSFSNFTWSIGFNNNSDKIIFKINIAKSFRVPIAKELAANGVNYHKFSYEIGKPYLDPEQAYQVDLGLEFNTKSFAISVTPFVNYFENYIYLNPSHNYDRLYGAGNQIFNYSQTEVIRFGGELHSHYKISKNISLGLIGEYVYSEQLSGSKKGYSLPFSPPAAVLFNLKYKKTKLFFLNNTYFSLDYVLKAAQKNIVPPEEITQGYQVVNMQFGSEIYLKNQKIIISMQIQNLLNNKYFNHTNYYRLLNIPEPSRNFVLNISIPFCKKLF